MDQKVYKFKQHLERIYVRADTLSEAQQYLSDQRWQYDLTCYNWQSAMPLTKGIICHYKVNKHGFGPMAWDTDRPYNTDLVDRNFEV